MSGPARGLLYGWRCAVCFGILNVSLCVPFAAAQDVAEAARQERDRKAVQAKPQKHVYTDEDLKRGKILTAEDQATVEARRKQQSASPAEQTAEANPENKNERTESLGEIARRYRQEKAAREAEQAKKNFAPFAYKIPGGSLATPKGGIRHEAGLIPGIGSRAGLTVDPAARPRSPTARIGGRARVSPFQPRPRIALSPMQRATPTMPDAISEIAKPVPSKPLASGEAAGSHRVQVQRGDSWWKLAERFLGDGARWRELRKLNSSLGGPPELLRLGSVIVVPETAKKREEPRRRQIIVKPGDSLWSLARTYFGRGSAWVCLAQANPQVTEYTSLQIGVALQLPLSPGRGGCPVESGSDLRK